jgi:hypothetical protein
MVTYKKIILVLLSFCAVAKAAEHKSSNENVELTLRSWESRHGDYEKNKEELFEIIGVNGQSDEYFKFLDENGYYNQDLNRAEQHRLGRRLQNIWDQKILVQVMTLLHRMQFLFYCPGNSLNIPEEVYYGCVKDGRTMLVREFLKYELGKCLVNTDELFNGGNIIGVRQPVDVAILNKDVEMVNILLSYLNKTKNFYG